MMARLEGSAPKIVFLALVKNGTASIAKFARLLDAMTRQGFRVAAVVGENGSTDDSKSLLRRISTNEAPVSVIDTSRMAHQSKRLARMAVGRDILRIAAAALHADAEFVCVCDADVIPGSWDGRALARSIEKLLRRPDLFGISATSFPYYDLLALRSQGLYMRNVQPLIERAKRNPLFYYSRIKLLLYDDQDAVTRSPIREATSAFNGLCIYRAVQFYAHSYVDGDRSGAICEHVIINTAIHVATGSRILIDNELTVIAPKEHIRQSVLDFYTSRAFKLATRWRKESHESSKS